MPLSTVCVSTVSSRPRVWSSYSNIRSKDVQGLVTMNSAEEISKYKSPTDNYYSPTLQRRLLGYGYDFPEKSPKKEKKWSIGSLFRRKKKDDSDTSSEEDLHKKGFLRKRRKSGERRKKPKLGTFDHVVLPRNCNGHSNAHDESGILSDPTGGFENYVNRALPKIPSIGRPHQDNPILIRKSRTLQEDSNFTRGSIVSGSAESMLKKNRKGLAKIRAEVRRSNLKHETSSDEDSQRSASSNRFKSDDSLNNGGRDSSSSRRSRTARTERYLKRHSKDGENPKDLLKLSKSDAENSLKLSDDSNRSLSRSPLIPITARLRPAKTSYSSLSSQSISGLATIPPPSHGSHSKIRVSNSTSNPSYKPPLSMNEYNYTTRNKLPLTDFDDFNKHQRSISCDSNIHKSEIQPEIIHVQFPIRRPTHNRQRNLTMVDPAQMRQPPPPPPRDPKRLVTAQYYESGRPSSYYFDSTGQMRSKSFNAPKVQHQSRKSGSFNLHPNYRSTSEDQLVNHSLTNLLNVSPRPSSATPDSTLNRQTFSGHNHETYNYLTDKKPRSRKPIFIQTNVAAKQSESNDKSGAQKALDFWRRKDKELEGVSGVTKSYQKPKSPQMFTCQTHVQTQVFLPSVLQSDLNSDNLHESLPNQNTDELEREDDLRRKSSNLEEALDELEAIYNSLRLGDEDLLERAEQREKEAALEKLKESRRDIYPNWMASRGTLSDSSFSYEPFDTVDAPRRKRLSRRSQTIDRRGDDMAYRKLNKLRSSTINDPQSVISKVSYLQTSPLYGRDGTSDTEIHKFGKEPDITLDDVVYRNIKYANNSNIVEPQPPFGIPLGPIAPGANSDYLHAVSDEIPRPTFKPRKIPDLVKDDLAFRNLRKDANKEPALPPLSADDLKNNNALDLNSLKKRRAVRSLSANIGSLITRDKFNYNNNDDNDVVNEFKTLTDIADAMEIARQVLKEKENRITNTRRAFLSDTDTSNSKNSSLTETRLNFLNSLKTPSVVDVNQPESYYLGAKLPRSPKELTPAPVSPLDDRLSDQDGRNESFDDLLTALAVEARETSERITKELRDFREEKEKNVIKNEGSSNGNLNRHISEIDAVSDQAKTCEKLLQGVVDSTKAPEEEVVSRIERDLGVKESHANIVLTPEERKLRRKSNVEKVAGESDHDYENLVSDKDLNGDEMSDANVEKCTSPFEEHKAELIASFQELKKNIDLELDAVAKSKSGSREVKKENDEISTGKKSRRSSRSRLPRWLFRPRSSGSLSDPTTAKVTTIVTTTMSDGCGGGRDGGSRAERIARYKEERKKQLASQFGNGSQQKDSSSSEGVPRTNRTTRLRVAAQELNGSSHLQASTKLTNNTEKFLAVSTSSQDVRSTSSSSSRSSKVDRDKSSKRKSNLNRALNCEEVPVDDDGGDSNKLGRRRARRFFPQELMERSKESAPSAASDANLTITSVRSQSPSPRASSNRKSELSLHMENARKGVTPSFSEMGKYGNKPKSVGLTRDRTIKKPTSDRESSYSDEKSNNKENSRRRTINVTKSTTTTFNSSDIKETSKRMEELTALTKKTLAGVERLANKNRESPRISKRQPSTSPIKQVANERRRLSSILKKKSLEEPVVEIINVQYAATPVSILKRKVSQDEKGEGVASSTPPVTFSPSVVDHAPSNRKQGILKKRRSLDESQVMRHRSCSPDVHNKTVDSRSSILKDQRRSSLEELRRIQSPEILHGILKRKTPRNDDEDHSLNSPQGILKRRSGASSAGSTGSGPHVSITTAVILAAAEGAEMILEPDFKPILKKKSFSDEHPSIDHYNYIGDGPKPILKKKSSTDTDNDCDDRPKRPILKVSQRDCDPGSDNNDNCDSKRLLRQSKDDFVKPRLSFSHDEGDDVVLRSQTRISRRSHTICSEFVSPSTSENKEEDRDLVKPRPLSVIDLVKSFETSVTTISTGAIPKKSSLKRSSDRYRTQPVTSNELEASLNFVENIPQFEQSNLSSNSLVNFASFLDNDSNLNSFRSSSFQSSPDNNISTKMSSDSAFQSLGDGLELDQEKSPESSIKNVKHEPGKLELQMKAIAEEAKRMKSARAGTSSSSCRFSTQPVTFREVQEAANSSKDESDRSGSARLDEADSAKLTLMERIKLFSSSPRHKEAIKPLIKNEQSSTRRRFMTRFQTQPVTFSEVESAKYVATNSALDTDDDKSTERRGILKSRACGDRSSPLPSKSALKNRGIVSKVSDVVYDEGISCNDSGSDSDIAIEPPPRANIKGNSDTTSDGESSGGREIRSIFRNENKLKVKLALESVLSKSKSQSVVVDEGGDSAGNKIPSSIRRSQTQAAMPRTIAELQAKLQQNGESDWKKRIQQNNNSNDELKLLKDKNKYNDQLSAKSVLALKKGELDAASHQWKSRVEKSDAEKFTVAGRMEKNKDGISLAINIPDDGCKKTPQAKRFKGKEGGDSFSTPVSPDKNRHDHLTRTYSVPDPDKHLLGSDVGIGYKAEGKKVQVSRPDDFTFKNFYKSVEEKKATDHLEISLDDLDCITRQSLLVQKKNVQVQRRRGASKNPIKALATRSDIAEEYTEIITGVAEREKKRLNIEKLAKNSNLAIEALAGLASREDFGSVALKKSSSTPSVPFKDVMLLQVKGRRHVQTRLVEPIYSSINEGDNFILITANSLYHYIGAYSNVIETNRATDIVNYIQQKADMGCKVSDVITVKGKNADFSSRQMRKFWRLLHVEDPEHFEGFTDAGNPTEDDIYESNLLSTNMIYKLDCKELVSWDEFWGSLPKIEMLEATNVAVFDFGSEMYVWSGKNAPFEKKKLALKLAKDLWDEGYDYSECRICPLNVASILGDRPSQKLPTKGKKRPDWALFSKVTQHRETILFKEKFLDWPDFSRVIRVKSDDTTEKPSDSSPIDIQPINVDGMVKKNTSVPDLVVEMTHLGRGRSYFDEETKRLFEFETIAISAWRILENNSEKIPQESLPHFYNGDSYIIRWRYEMSVKGRELGGKPSRYGQSGREKTLYFLWQGAEASINEKGLAALVTVELDSEKAPQVRVVQGSEPAAFLSLFRGERIVHQGKRGDTVDKAGRLYLVQGEIKEETSLIEVPCDIRQLRSRTSFILVEAETSRVTVWHGAKSMAQKRMVAEKIAEKLSKSKATEFGLDDECDVNKVEEGDESSNFFRVVGRNRDLYVSLCDSDFDYDFTPRLFNLSSVSGEFKATEIPCPHRSEYSSPYPFWQTELYSASQPALFLIDNHHELWLWQGWWPEREEELVELQDQTGSGAIRYQSERKAAMQTTLDYWRKLHPQDVDVPAYLVWAGLEPLQFKNLFPTWENREDVAEINLKDGRKSEAKLSVEKELALLSRTTYPLAELMQRPLPEGVVPTLIENYLSSEDFEIALSMSREDFKMLPSWKQKDMKKDRGLF